MQIVYSKLPDRTLRIEITDKQSEVMQGQREALWEITRKGVGGRGSIETDLPYRVLDGDLRTSLRSPLLTLRSSVKEMKGDIGYGQYATTDIGYEVEEGQWHSLIDGNDLKKLPEVYFQAELIADVMFGEDREGSHDIWEALQPDSGHKKLLLENVTECAVGILQLATVGDISDSQFARIQRAREIAQFGQGVRDGDYGENAFIHFLDPSALPDPEVGIRREVAV